MINHKIIQRIKPESVKKFITLDYAAFKNLMDGDIFCACEADAHAVRKYGAGFNAPAATTLFKVHSAISTSHGLSERHGMLTSIEYLNSVISSTREHMGKALHAVEGWDMLYFYRGNLFYRDGSVRLAFADYMRAAQLNPYNPEVFCHVAGLFKYFMSTPPDAGPAKNPALMNKAPEAQKKTPQMGKMVEAAQMTLLNLGVALHTIDSRISTGSRGMVYKYGQIKSPDPVHAHEVMAILDGLDTLLGERVNIAKIMRATFSQFSKAYPDQVGRLKEGIQKVSTAFGLPSEPATPKQIEEIAASIQQSAPGFLESALSDSGMSPEALRAYRDSGRASIPSSSLDADDVLPGADVSNRSREMYSGVPGDEMADQSVWKANRY